MNSIVEDIIVKFVFAIQKCFCNKFVMFLENAFINFLNIKYSSRFKEGAVKEEMGYSSYF